MMKPPQAICFDLDGVLIDTMPLHADAWQEAVRRFGLRVRRREIYSWEGEPGTATAKRLLRRQGRRSMREAAELLRLKEALFKRSARRIRVHPRLAAWIAQRSRRGLAIGLVTGTSAHEVRRIVPAALRRQFRVIVTGTDVRRGKPDPEPYRTAFARLRVAPRRAAVVENAPYGITSARRAGAGCIVALVSSLPPRYLRGADRIVRSVAELIRTLDRLVRVN